MTLQHWMLWPSAGVSRDGLMESWTCRCRYCCGGLPPDHVMGMRLSCDGITWWRAFGLYADEAYLLFEQAWRRRRCRRCGRRCSRCRRCRREREEEGTPREGRTRPSRGRASLTDCRPRPLPARSRFPELVTWSMASPRASCQPVSSATLHLGYQPVCSALNSKSKKLPFAVLNSPLPTSQNCCAAITILFSKKILLFFHRFNNKKVTYSDANAIRQCGV